MKRAALWLLGAVPLVVVSYWIASHTYWGEVQVPMPPKGEALTNPFYAAQRFTEALGARSARDRVLTVPPPGSVIVLAAWHWSLSAARRDALERWVQSGGRLVVEGFLAGGEYEFEQWSGIVREDREPEPEEEHDFDEHEIVDPCGTFAEEREGAPVSGPESGPRSICSFSSLSFLTTSGTPAWALRDESGIQAMRVRVGRGSVTVVNGEVFRYQDLFEGDHAWLFVAATQLRRGDDVHFLSEDDHPSLLALLWQHGAPVVVLGLALAGLVLWRGGVRLGPLAPPQPAARRSLAEQIRGTGQFALRHGGGESLQAACARALEEAATRRIPGYALLSAGDRAAALARLTGFDRHALAAAIHHAGLRRAHELRSTIALLEAARRQILLEHGRSRHGTV